jgi:hypothetical protein
MKHVNKFHDFLTERKDSEKVHEIKGFVEELFLEYIKMIINTCENKIQDSVTNVFGLNLHTFTYKNVVLNITKGYSLNNALASYNNKRITIYNTPISEGLLDSIEHIERIIKDANLPNLRNSRYSAEKEREMALSYVDDMTKYVDWKNIYHLVFHEMVHYHDDLNYDILSYTRKRNKAAEDKGGSDADVINNRKEMYFNSTTEVNAFFLDALHRYERDNLPLGTFEDFKTKFFGKYYKVFNELNTNNQRKISKRLYDYYMKKSTPL